MKSLELSANYTIMPVRYQTLSNLLSPQQLQLPVFLFPHGLRKILSTSAP